MNNIIAKTKEQTQQLKRGSRIINLVLARRSSADDAYHRAGNLPLEQVSADSHQIGLNASVRRRIRAQLEDAHDQGLGYHLFPVEIRRRKFPRGFKHAQAADGGAGTILNGDCGAATLANRSEKGFKLACITFLGIKA